LRYQQQDSPPDVSEPLSSQAVADESETTEQNVWSSYAQAGFRKPRSSFRCQADEAGLAPKPAHQECSNDPNHHRF
jgi:hypothetical protein